MHALPGLLGSLAVAAHAVVIEHATDWPAVLAAVGAVVAAVAAVVTAGIILLSALYARETVDSAREALVDARRTRDAQLLVDLARRWDEHDVLQSQHLRSQHGDVEVLELLKRLYAPRPDRLSKRQRRKRGRDLDLYYALFVWPNVIDTTGVLWEQNALSGEAIYKTWGYNIIGAWEDWESAVKLLRRLDDDDDIYRYFEQLAEAMRERHRAAVGGRP